MKHVHSEKSSGWLATYFPLLLIMAYIVGVSFVAHLHFTGVYWHGWMDGIMAGFFLVFSAFKFLDLRGFAETYATYDLLAKRWHAYGYIYPFLELGLGLLYVTHIALTATYIATIIIMGFSSLGVIQALSQNRKFRCACLGTVLNLPMSSITLIEDLLMVAMAVVMLVVRSIL